MILKCVNESKCDQMIANLWNCFLKWVFQEFLEADGNKFIVLRKLSNEFNRYPENMHISKFIQFSSRMNTWTWIFYLTYSFQFFERGIQIYQWIGNLSKCCNFDQGHIELFTMLIWFNIFISFYQKQTTKHIWMLALLIRLSWIINNN